MGHPPAFHLLEIWSTRNIPISSRYEKCCQNAPIFLLVVGWRGGIVEELGPLVELSGDGAEEVRLNVKPVKGETVAEKMQVTITKTTTTTMVRPTASRPMPPPPP